MAKEKLVLIGGGGHCKVVIKQINKLDKFEIVGITDSCKKGSLQGVPILGGDEKLKSLFDEGVRNSFISVGSTADNFGRRKLFDYAEAIGFRLPVLVASEAIMDDEVIPGSGTIVMPGSIVNIGAVIGENCIINSGAIVEHDCIIGDHCHIAPGATISGGVEIGELSFVGIGSSIIQGVKIGRNVTIGAGSVIIRDIPDNSVVVGNPGRFIRVKDTVSG